MRFRDYILSTVLIAGFAFGFSFMNTPQAAQAYVHANPPYLDPTYETPLFNLLNKGVAYPTSTIPAGGGSFNVPGGVQLSLFEAGESASLYPALFSSLTTIGIAAGGFAIGWKIGRTIDNKWLHLEGQTGSPSTNATVVSNNWCAYGTSGCGTAGATTDSANSLSAASPRRDGVYNMIFSGACVMSATVSNITVVYDPAGWIGAGSMPTCMQNAWSAFNAFVPQGTTNLISVNAGDCNTDATALFGASKWSTGAGTGCYERIFKENNAEAQFVHGLPQDYTNQTADVTTNLPSTSCGGANQQICAPAGSPTAAQVTAAQGAITAAGSTTQGWTNCELAPQDYICPDGSNPGGASPPFALLRPLPNETYNDYITRLRSQGYVGNITLLDDVGYDGIPGDAYDPTSAAIQLSPKTVTGVGVGTALGSIIPLYYPASDLTHTPGSVDPWPTTTTTVTPATTTDIVILKVPDGYTPPPPSGGGTPPPGSPPGSPGSSSCNLPNIPNLDITPLTGMDFGNKFPFGVFAWLTTVYGYFNVTAVAPAVDLNMSGLSSFVPGFSAHYAFDLSYFSTYMGTIRDLISFALWVGAIWYVGTALLGFRASGDVSDAADEGFVN